MTEQAARDARQHGAYLIQEMVRHLESTAPDHAAEFGVDPTDYTKEALRGAKQALKRF